MKPTVVVNDETIEVGEIPRWHADEGVLYWQDISKQRLFRFDPASGTNSCVLESGAVRGMSVQDDGVVLLSGPHASLAAWCDGELTSITEGMAGESAFNDSMVDPEGRIFGSQMAKHDENNEMVQAGRICRVDQDGSYHIVAPDIEAPNGIILSGDEKAIYVADNSCATVWAFDYDRASGSLGDRRALIELSEGTPDGMDVDAEGQLWLTACGGGYAGCYDLDGKLLRQIDFPTKAITAIAFGGQQLETLYATSLGGVWRAGPDDLSGCVFAVDAGVRGKPHYRSRIPL